MEKDIELRSEEVQEILTRPPHALVRWGVTVFFGVLVVVFIGGCFFKYPDVISASVTVTTEHPPIWIVARGSGKIKEVYRHDRDSVGAGDAIAVLDNPASTRDVLLLKELLGQFSLADSSWYAAGRFPEPPAKPSETSSRCRRRPDRLGRRFGKLPGSALILKHCRPRLRRLP